MEIQATFSLIDIIEKEMHESILRWIEALSTTCLTPFQKVRTVLTKVFAKLSTHSAEQAYTYVRFIAEQCELWWTEDRLWTLVKEKARRFESRDQFAYRFTEQRLPEQPRPWNAISAIDSLFEELIFDTTSVVSNAELVARCTLICEEHAVYGIVPPTATKIKRRMMADARFAPYAKAFKSRTGPGSARGLVSYRLKTLEERTVASIPSNVETTFVTFQTFEEDKKQAAFEKLEHQEHAFLKTVARFVEQYGSTAFQNAERTAWTYFYQQLDDNTVLSIRTTHPKPIRIKHAILTMTFEMFEEALQHYNYTSSMLLDINRDRKKEEEKKKEYQSRENIEDFSVIEEKENLIDKRKKDQTVSYSLTARQTETETLALQTQRSCTLDKPVNDQWSMNQTHDQDTCHTHSTE